MTAREEVRQTVEAHYAAVEKVAASARRFLRTYDEFWDVYKPAIGEDFGTLCEAVLEYERLCEHTLIPAAILPPYEP